MFSARTAALLCATCLTLPAIGTSARGQQAPGPERPPGADLHAGSLPAGAVARLGTVRCRDSSFISLPHIGYDLPGAVAYSPDGKVLASAVPGGVVFWDSRSGERIREQKTSSRPIIALRF